METVTPIFSKTDDYKFFRTLNKRVNDYFKENNIEKTGNWKLHLKTIILFTTPCCLACRTADSNEDIALFESSELDCGKLISTKL